MPQTEFIVKARSRTGRLVESVIRASTEAEALAIIRQQGSLPIAVTQKPSGGLNREIHLGRKRIKKKDLAVATRQMATMLSSGLPVLRCLTILADQSPNPNLRDLFLDVRRDVEQGTSVSEALARHDQIPQLMVSLVQAGEVGGFLDTAMLQIAETLEAEVKLRSQIKAAMTYPIAVACLAVVIVTGMLIFIVPVFSDMFSSMGGQLPLPTQILVTLSNILKNPMIMLPLTVAIITAVVLFRRFHNRPAVRNVIDPLKFRLPVFGPLFKKIALARFSRNFATLVRAGVPIMTTLDIVGATSGNIIIERAVADVKTSVREGAGMSVPFSRHEVFPQMVVQMIAVGEDTGALEDMLDKIAEFYEQEAAATTEQLTSLIEPLMLVIMGVVVGAMVIALYLPIFNIFELVNQ